MEFHKTSPAIYMKASHHKIINKPKRIKSKVKIQQYNVTRYFQPIY